MALNNFENELIADKEVNYDGMHYIANPFLGLKLEPIKQLYDGIKDDSIREKVSSIIERDKNRKCDIKNIKPESLVFLSDLDDSQKEKAEEIETLTYDSHLMEKGDEVLGQNPQIMSIGIEGSDELAAAIYKINDEGIFDIYKKAIVRPEDEAEELTKKNSAIIDYLAVNPFLERGHMYDIFKKIFENLKEKGYKFVLSETALPDLYDVYRKVGFQIFIDKNIEEAEKEIISKIKKTELVDLPKLNITSGYELLFRYSHLPNIPTQTMLLAKESKAYLLKEL